MTRWLVMAAVMAGSSVASGHEERERRQVDEGMIEAVGELRDQIGPVAGSAQDFERGLRQAAGQDWDKPGLRRPDAPIPPDAGAPPSQPLYRDFAPTPRNWAPTNPPQPYSPEDQLFTPSEAFPPLNSNRPPRPEADPKQMLREAAFELDQMAHRFEMASLYNEADALREAAQRLRESARERGEARSNDQHRLVPPPTSRSSG